MSICVTRHISATLHIQSLPNLARLECPAGDLSHGGERPAGDICIQRKLPTLYPPIRILRVWLVFVHACAFTIIADSNARCY